MKKAEGADRFANSATRAVDRGTAALAARDWRAFAALMAPGFRHYDRTRIAHLESDGREWLASNRRIVEMTSGTPAYRVLATRDERLALFEMLWRGAKGDVGPSEIEQRLIVEVNERGEHAAIVVYDPEDIDAAYAELDARYEAEQGDRLPASWTLLRRWVRAVAERDWKAVASFCADDFVEHDHRSLSLLGVTHGVEPWIQVIRTVSDLAPDSVFRIRHFIPGKRGYYEEGGFCGTREGGPFEILINALVEIDDQGLLKRIDTYDDDRVFASPRWAELGIPVPGGARESDAPRPTAAEPNAATRAGERWRETFDTGFRTGNWEPMRRMCSSDHEFIDRRRMALVDGDRELMIASAQERAASGARPQFHLAGTAGERVDIQRVLWSGGPADGRFEIEYLAVTEVDESGLIAAFVLFDLDDARAAQREAWARWAAIEPEMQEPIAVISDLTDRFNDGDRAGVRALCADDLFAEDHRRTGLGRIDGADAYMESLEALWKLAPDQRLELGWHWPAYGPHGGVTVVRRFGTLPDGGAFESEYLEIFVVAHGRATHLELFEIDDLERALARFAELRGTNNEALGNRPPVPRGDHRGVAAPPPHPLLDKEGDHPRRIPPNVATSTWERWYGAGTAGDWDTVDALAHPSYRIEDRRRLFRMTLDVETTAVNDRFFFRGGWRAERTLLATAGDFLALHQILWATGEPGAPSQIEMLELDEVDGEGRFVRSLIFDPDDRAGASAELFERYVALGAEGMPHGAIEFSHGWNGHDLTRARSGLCDDFVLDDHRRTGMGRLEGADVYIASVAALYELIPDVRADFLYQVALAEDGRVAVTRTSGVNTEGGEVESFFVSVLIYREGKMSRFEMFEIEHLDAAVARFEALRTRT